VPRFHIFIVVHSKDAFIGIEFKGQLLEIALHEMASTASVRSPWLRSAVIGRKQQYEKVAYKRKGEPEIHDAHGIHGKKYILSIRSIYTYFQINLP
jgi:hypothetical protein